ncbi:cytochrome C biogenesis protein [Tepidicaulis marinus]|uniref:Cytochrome c-type biogenesis protein n=1 Tax=Tepidicaulis marinus TaxID=1333998 RepID=A0A081BAV0_9HYPH|nr:cytochrome c-type biogenesis protein [Tepidicaulis marinus]GAK45168.1 cytochrome C biogenesis protein [Tepidicaulis marinus]
MTRGPFHKGAVLLLAAALWTGLAFPAGAIEPGEKLDNPKLEERARELSRELRCLVCQNQSIDDSDAPLARDLRLLVRERLKEGDSNEEVLDYIVARYGDFVLLRPPVRPETWALWAAPFIALFIGGVVVLMLFRRKKETAAEAEPLSDEEAARLDELMEKADAKMRE